MNANNIRMAKTNFFITADLGLLRAYRLVQDTADRQPHLELVEELKPEAAHQKVADQVTDASGRFPKGGGAGHVAGDLSAGEQHNADLEQTRRLITLLATKINSLLTVDTVESCCLAVSAPIHLRLLDELTTPVRAKISQSLALDLAKLHPTELLKHLPCGG